ncbi:MAG: alpha-galactosidase [Clostridiales bacterium]|nr:alpha-galactosidase [Clostridiales bacterium]
MKPTSVSISFYQHNMPHTVEFPGEEAEQFFDAEYIFDFDHFRLLLKPKKPVELEELKVVFPYTFEKSDCIFMNGYQSWTVAKEYSVDTTNVIAERMAKLMKHAPQDNCGDRYFTEYPKQNRWLHGVSYGYVRQDEDFRLFGSLSEKDGFTFFDIHTEDNTLTIRKDVAKRIVDDSYLAFDIVFLQGTEKEVFDEYFRLLHIGPSKAKPVTGYTTWYRHQQDINEKKLLADVKEITDAYAKYPCKFFFIDEGYEHSIGDWLVPKKNHFPHGLSSVTMKMLEASIQPGIWIAPFVCDKKSHIYNHHRDWLLRSPSGDLVEACKSWKELYCIDVTNVAFRHHLKNVLVTMRDDWGISAFKFDFLFAACALPSPTMTRGEKMYDAVRFLKECVGDSVTIGCGVPLMAAAGVFDYCQVSCDCSPDWFPPLTLASREQNSTYRALVDLIFHRQLAGRAFGLFNNVLPLTNKAFLFDDDRRSLMARIQGLSKGMILTSDEISKYTAEDTVAWNVVHSLQEAEITKVYYQNRQLVLEYKLFDQPQQLILPLHE